MQLKFSGQSGSKNIVDALEPYNMYDERYATELKAQIVTIGSFTNWRDTDKEEIKKILPILMMMGNNKLRQMRLYWSKSFMVMIL